MQRKPDNRAAVSTNFSAKPPGANAACTVSSRPNATPSSVARSKLTSGRSRALHRSLLRPSSDPSDAARRTATRPSCSQPFTLTNPATACPARRAKPRNSVQRRTSSVSTCSANPSSTPTRRRAAKAKRFRAHAVLMIFRSALNQIPRPGSRPTTSGTTILSGPTTKRTISDAGRRRFDTMQRRCGPSSSTKLSALAIFVAVGIKVVASLRLNRHLFAAFGFRRRALFLC